MIFTKARSSRRGAAAILCVVAVFFSSRVTTVAFLPSSTKRQRRVYKTVTPVSPKRCILNQKNVLKQRRLQRLYASSIDTASVQKEPATVVSSMEQVHQCIKHNDTSPLVVNGHVTAKRSFGSSFGFIDVHVDEELVQLMVKRQAYHGELGGMLQGINIGMHLRVVGVASATRNPGEGVILVHFVEIKRLPPNPQHVCTLLRLVSQGKLNATQIAPACNMTADYLSARIIHATSITQTNDYNSLAKELISWLPSREKQSGVGVTSESTSKRSFPVVPPDLCRHPVSYTDLDTTDSTRAIFIASISDLRDRLEELKESVNLVALEAWVQNRRRFRDSITVLKVSDVFVAVAHDSNAQNDRDSSRLQSVLHPDLLGETTHVYGSLLCAGSRALLEGYIVLEPETTTPTLWVTSVRLLHCSWRPMVVRHLIELIVRDEFDVDEAANALNIDSMQVAELLQLDLTERQWKANEISQTLQDSQSRTAHVSAQMMNVLSSFEGLRNSYPAQQVHNSSTVSLKEVDCQENNSLLATNVPGTWWQRKKRPQLEFMGQQIQDVVRSHPDYGNRKLRILDVGGGKGVLANYLAQLLGNTVQVQVIDIAGGAIKNGMMRSKRLAAPVEYFVGDASQFENETDIVVALHACGALSDVALGHAVNYGAGFVICPCCFRSNPSLRVPVQQDGRRSRQFESPQEWLGVDANDFDSIKSLAEIQGDAELASKAMHTICAMRAAAVHRLSNERGGELELQVAIKTFPVSFSTRNFCLVGNVQRRG